LNANRIEPLQVSDTRRFVGVASNLPLSDAYPILCWVIENAIRRRGHSEEAKRLLHSTYDAAIVGCELSFRLGGRASDRFRCIVARDFRESSGTGLIVRSGRRVEALAFLRDWLAQNVADYLKICDPYFGTDDLEALRLIPTTGRPLTVGILTSSKRQDRDRGGLPLQERYRNKWAEMSDQSPPPTEVVVVGNSLGDLPIHDRWWLTRGKGLRIGTSFGSLGDVKESEISLLSAAEALQCEARVDEYLSLRKREHNGERLSLSVFSL
jgi:hypothetical protein